MESQFRKKLPAHGEKSLVLSGADAMIEKKFRVQERAGKEISRTGNVPTRVPW